MLYKLYRLITGKNLLGTISDNSVNYFIETLKQLRRIDDEIEKRKVKLYHKHDKINDELEELASIKKKKL